ncbi:MAG: ribose-phosphate pyrophosphokinase, partial [Oscillospiraceae bacterium]
GPAIDRINNSVIKEVTILDTVLLPETKISDKITQLPVGPVFAEAIERIYQDKPISSLFV